MSASTQRRGSVCNHNQKPVDKLANEKKDLFSILNHNDKILGRLQPFQPPDKAILKVRFPLFRKSQLSKLGRRSRDLSDHACAVSLAGSAAAGAGDFGAGPAAAAIPLCQPVPPRHSRSRSVRGGACRARNGDFVSRGRASRDRADGVG